MVIDRNNAYHRLFLEETEDQLGAIEEDLLQFESQGYSENLIQRLFRNAHSIKGSTATMGLTEMTAITHELETLFNQARQSGHTLSPAAFDKTYQLLDQLRQHYNGLLTDSPHTKGQMSQGQSSQGQSSQGPLSDKPSTEDSSIEGRFLLIQFGPGADFLGIKAFQILRALSDLSAVENCSPADPELIEEDDVFEGRFAVELKTSVARSAVQDALLPISDIATIQISAEEPQQEVIPAPPQTPEQGAEPMQLQSSAPEGTYLKLSSETVDQLIALTTELSLDRSALALMIKQLAAEHPKHATVRRLMERIEVMEAPVKRIQNTVLAARMLPLQTLFRELPRTVRDLSQQLGKLIRLEMEGGQLTLDKQVLQALYDPLQHLVRNAIDHGIEPLEERLNTDKRPDGLLRIHASQSDNALILSLSDDGRGIDVRSIEKQALAKGLVTLEECSFYTKEDWFNLLFRSGFSTKAEASAISGRGVGLDVVRENLQAINGQIRITSEPQLGTTFVIRVPISLSLSKNLILQHGAYQLALPIDNIQEIVRLKPGTATELHWTAYSCTFVWNDAPIPVFDPLTRSMPQAPDPSEDTGTDSDTRAWADYLVVIGTSDSLYGLLTSTILREEELLMIPMGHYNRATGILKADSHLMSAAILNDGSLCYSFDLTAFAHADIPEDIWRLS